jgi:hypothetical protein
MPPHNYFSERFAQQTDISKIPPPSKPAVVTTSSNAAEVPATQENIKMSIFTTIDKDAKTAVTKIEAAFVKLWKEEPKAEAIAAQIITETAPEIVAIAAVVAGAPGAAAANDIISEVKVGLATVQAALTAAGAGSATSASTILTALVANLQGLLAVAQVKDPATLATATTDISTIVAGLQVLIAAL